MTHISYVDPKTVQDPELLAIMERARSYGTPRPESQAIRLHHPEVMKAFNNAWEVFFRQGVTDHAIKELCRLYISKSVQCEYCGGQRSVLARQQGTTEDQVDEILDFECSERFDDRERAALEWAMAIAWDPTLAADDLWDRLHQHFTEPQLVELGHFIALTLGQQRFLKTVGVLHGEVLADTDAGLAPKEAERVRAHGASRSGVRP
jgi:alkylhydroperoxidase family enzyme